MPRSQTPVGSACPVLSTRRCCLPHWADGVGSHEVTLSRLHHAACTLPVYASRRQLPAARATLGFGCGPALPNGIGYPLSSFRRFPPLSSSTCGFPLLQALPGAPALRPQFHSQVVAFTHGRGAFASTSTCVGDCASAGVVDITNLITGVNIVLEERPVGACLAFGNAQGQVDIAQIIRAVNNALNGCAD